MWRTVDNALTRDEHSLKTRSTPVDNECGQMCTTPFFLTGFSAKNHTQK